MTPTLLQRLRPRSTRVLPILLAALAALLPRLASAQERPEPLPGDYRVVEGRVDRGTYAGWRLFQANCQRCHGIGAVGTDKAPNLLERITNFTPRGFATKVLTSYRIVRLSPENEDDREAERQALLEQVMRRERTARGMPVMPAWDADEDVSPHVLDLYAYLTARADGAIGAGPPSVQRAEKKR